jgi:hypothetical protein
MPEDKHHHEENGDIIDAMRATLQSPAMTVETRIRIGSALGAIFAGAILASSAFDDIPNAELSAQLGRVVRNILTPGA